MWDVQCAVPAVLSVVGASPDLRRNTTKKQQKNLTAEDAENSKERTATATTTTTTTTTTKTNEQNVHNIFFILLLYSAVRCCSVLFSLCCPLRTSASSAVKKLYSVICNLAASPVMHPSVVSVLAVPGSRYNKTL